TGYNFSNTPADNIVYFGAVRAVVIAADSVSLRVTVPAEATYRPITVTSHQLTAYSGKPFIVTFKSATPAFTDTSFVETTDSSAGNFPLHTAVGDLNNDGKADLVVTNTFTNSISILENTGTAGAVSFAPKKDLPVYQNPARSYIADLDGDGRPDIVSVTKYSTVFTDSIYIFRNTGTGGAIAFTRMPNLLAEYETVATGVTVHDFNGDGKPDLILSDEAGISLEVFQNISTPDSISFIRLPNLSAGSLPQDVFAMDIDGDGRTDLAAVNSGNVYVYKNISPRSDTIVFASPIYIDDGFSHQSIFLGDLDGDGLPEMAVTNRGNNNFSIYPNTSVAGNISFAPRISYSLGNIPYN
ncbi:MAG: VCBS repeat-containing protein, partial [Chitinophaga rupis]